MLHKAQIQGLHRTIQGLYRSALCAQTGQSKDWLLIHTLRITYTCNSKTTGCLQLYYTPNDSSTTEDALFHVKSCKAFATYKLWPQASRAYLFSGTGRDDSGKYAYLISGTTGRDGDENLLLIAPEVRDGRESKGACAAKVHPRYSEFAPGNIPT